MSRRAVVMLVALCAAAHPAAAAEFLPSWDLDGGWNSNVLRTETNKESDFSIRNGPTLRVRETKGTLTYDVKYQVLYEAFTRLQGINAFDQYASGSGSWVVTPTTTLSASNNFAYTSSLEGLFLSTGNITTIAPQRERITSNGAQASLTHNFGPLWQLTASGSSQIYDYRNPNQADTTSYSGSLQLTRSVSRRLVAGFGAQYQRQEFAEIPGNPGNGTSFYQGFGVLQYSISPTWRISAQGGPAWAVPDASTVNSVNLPSYLNVDPRTCPRNAAGVPVYLQFPQSSADLCGPAFFQTPQGFVLGLLSPAPAGDTSFVPFVGEQGNDPTLEYFGQVSIEKNWRLWRASLEYSRSASNSSGYSASTTLDQVTGTLQWHPTALWDVQLTAIYSLQTQVSQLRQREVLLNTAVDTQTIPGAFAVYGIPYAVGTGGRLSGNADITAYLLRINAERRLSRHLSLRGAASYWHQDTSGPLQTQRVPEFRVSVGFTWTFEPIPL